jgi:hypothetical protein
METELVSRTLCFFKKLGDVQKSKIMSVNFRLALFCHLSAHDLVTQAFVWLHMIQFGASYANLKVTSHG